MTLNEIRKEKILTGRTNKFRSKTLSMLIGEAEKIAKEAGRETNGNDIVDSAKRNIKALTGTIEQVKEGPLVESYKEQIKIYEEFLPKMVSTEELNNRILALVSVMPEDKRNMKSMGVVLGMIKKEYGESVDMTTASTIVKEKLC
jgi:uncharacterized protein YqeY